MPGLTTISILKISSRASRLTLFFVSRIFPATICSASRAFSFWLTSCWYIPVENTVTATKERPTRQKSPASTAANFE